MNCDDYPWSAYRRTHVEVHLHDGSTHIIEQTETGSGEWPFNAEEVWILTAFNPRSEPLSSDENEKRHKQLGQQLDELDLFYFDARGFDPQYENSSQWSEAGYGVVGDVGEIVLNLAREWEQNAVFVWRPDEWLIKGVLLEGECKSRWHFV